MGTSRYITYRTVKHPESLSRLGNNQYLFLVGIYGGTFLGLIAHIMREKIEERG